MTTDRIIEAALERTIKDFLRRATRVAVQVMGTEFWVTISKKEARMFIANRGVTRVRCDLRNYPTGGSTLFLEAREV